MTIRCIPFGLLALIGVTVSCPLSADDTRFVRLDAAGQALATTAETPSWPCVLDRNSGLTWEVKTTQAGLHQRERTFSWYQTNPQQNGGDPGEPGTTDCDSAPCNTQALVQAVNHAGWCGAHDWRLPTREELRSLVDYRITYPGPMLDSRYFPQAAAQFYWSDTANASDVREAWGIGFAFGFDYAYFKTNRVHVRLVRQSHLTEQATQ